MLNVRLPLVLGVGNCDATRLSYAVDITPKGVVPVPAIEWRIREDVPSNLQALKTAVEALPRPGV